MKVTYNFHNCFTVELDEHIFVFDYFDPSAMTRAADGDAVISFDKNKKIYVFASHVHPDHYSDSVMEWKKEYPDIKYVLSDDIRPCIKDAVTFVSANKSYELDDLKIETLKSTDEGVAFIIEAEGKSIYHAGDLHWWYWAERGPEYVKKWGDLYTDEIDKIAGRHFDAAFVLLDPRMKSGYAHGMLEFLKRIPDAPCVFSMHMWKQYPLINKFKSSKEGTPYKDRIMDITHEGQEFII